MAEPRTSRLIERQRLRLAVECISVAVDRMLAAEARVEALSEALRGIEDFCKKAPEDLWPSVEWVHMTATETLRAAPPVPETPKREPEHVEADCPGLNPDGMCPHGYGRTCCQFPGGPVPEREEAG